MSTENNCPTCRGPRELVKDFSFFSGEKDALVCKKCNRATEVEEYHPTTIILEEEEFIKRYPLYDFFASWDAAIAKGVCSHDVPVY